MIVIIDAVKKTYQYPYTTTSDPSLCENHALAIRPATKGPIKVPIFVEVYVIKNALSFLGSSLLYRLPTKVCKFDL